MFLFWKYCCLIAEWPNCTCEAAGQYGLVKADGPWTRMQILIQYHINGTYWQSVGASLIVDRGGEKTS